MQQTTVPRMAAVIGGIALAASTMMPATATTPSDFSLSGVRGVKVVVKCSTNPEKVIIKNNRKKAITVKKVGSTYQPRSAEPYTVNRRLRPGRKIVFSFGTASGPNRLTRQFIFSDTSSREKAKVITNLGKITKRC